MLPSKILLDFFKKKKISFFSGVPDSILKKFSFSLNGHKNHFICTNEGSAVSMAIGNYLSTNIPGLVYMQNSGLSNAINPLISIADKAVYSVPVILLIGWRGAPGFKDEPQHLTKGKITIKLLNILKIKYQILKSKKDLKKISNLINFSKKNKVPVAILCKKGVLSGQSINIKNNNITLPSREELITALLENINKKTKIISTTGYTSRELFQLRKIFNNKNSKDFYMVGGMGHASMVALGVSLKTKKNIICLDGDGSMLMHMGALTSVSFFGKKNFKYILLNNSAHESVGGQKTNANLINFSLLAKSLKFKSYVLIKNKAALKKKLKLFLKSSGPSFLEVKIKVKSMKNLERPENFKLIKKKFSKF